MAGAPISDIVQAGGSNETIVRHDIPALHELSDRGREIVLAYIEAVGPAYIELGRRQVEDEWRGRLEVSKAIARQIAQAGPYDERARRRGEHQRADAHVATLRARGVIQ